MLKISALTFKRSSYEMIEKAKEKILNLIGAEVYKNE